MRITVIRFFFLPAANMNFHELHMRSALPLATNGTQELLMNYYLWNITWVITCVLHVASQTRNSFVWD